MCTDNNTLKKRFLNPIPDVGVIYTGPDIPALGIVKDCNDLRLSDIEAIIIERLLQHSQGQGIKLETITGNCAFVTQFLATSDKSLASLIQGLFDANCTLREYIQTVENKLEPPFSFDLKCLTTVLPAQPSRNQIIQALLNMGCDNTDRLDKIEEDLANAEDPESTIINTIQQVVGNLVKDMFTSCQDTLIKTGLNAESKINIIGSPPKGTILYGKYDKTSFDDTGLGLAEKGMCGWALANGNNGTEDVRGFTLSSTIDTQGPALHSLVQPGIDPDLVAAYLTRKGRNKGILNSSQLPDHQHNVSDPGHKHTVHAIIHQDSPDFGNGGAGMDTWFGNIDSSVSQTGITVTGVKGTSGQPIDFRQPTIYLRAIQRIA